MLVDRHVLTHNHEMGDLPDVNNPGAALAVLGTARAVRRFRGDPVPEPLVEALIWAATRASSPNNTQLWHFIVVRSPDQRAAMAACLRRFSRWIDSLAEPADESDARIRRDARHLLTHLAEAPVIIAVCAEHRYPPEAPDVRYLWSVVNTASQNLIVAAHSLGLGAALTMLQVGNESALEQALGLPDYVRIGTIIPVGWPEQPSGPVRRRPIAEVIHHDRW